MNNKQIQDLTRHLSQALDQNYDVVNMETVLAVISTLEGTTITKEQLEATRLAKYINHLRRRTNNEQLARRAKSLLKKWREMVGMQQQPCTDPIVMPTSTLTTTTTAPSIGQSASMTLNRYEIPGNVNFTKSIMNQQGSLSTSPTNSRSQTARLSLLHTITTVPTSSSVSVDMHTNRFQSTETSPHRQKSLAATTTTESAIINAQNKLQRQPTSFSNLISNLNSSNNNLKRQSATFHSSNNNNSTSAGILDLSTGNFTKPHEHQKQQQNTMMTSETLVLDHSSNSNSTSHFIAHNHQRKLNDVPIVIDIDSDSGDMNIMLQSQQKLVTPVTTVGSVPIPSLFPIARQASNVKSKKSKKEKKRKEKDNHSKKDLITTHSVVTSDELSNQKEPHSPQKVIRPKNSEDLILSSYVRGDQLQKCYPSTISNMSEILSLSNSSMSSMFPGENNLKTVSNVSGKKVRSLDNELTFTGKFKSSSDSSNYMNNLTASSLNGREISASDSAVTEKQGNARSAFGNENSTSSSRVFPFEMIDVVSHDNKNHIKLFNEHRGMTSGVVSDTSANDRTMAGHETDLKDAVAAASKTQKKRGRKKGSKGVDAIIAHETSLSQQIFGSGGKKVKTTKELFNEIKNRKLAAPDKEGTGLSKSSQQYNKNKMHVSRPTSSCSEPSIHSPHTMDASITNITTSARMIRSSPDNSNQVEDGAAASDSDTTTTDPSNDDASNQLEIKRSNSIDSSSSSQFISGWSGGSSKQLPQRTTSSKTIKKAIASEVDIQLKDFIKELPAPNSRTALEIAYTAQLVPCTCIIIEEDLPNVKTSTDEDAAQISVPESDILKNNVNSAQVQQGKLSVAIQLANTSNSMEKGAQSITSATSSQTTVVVQKPKKSIFDLDFDEDDDPLQSLIAEAAAETDMKSELNDVELNTISVNIGVKSENMQNGEERTNIAVHLQSMDQPQQQQQQDDTANGNVEGMPFSLYRVEEDVNCVAKQRYNIQTNKITSFHVDTLHNCYIPNINGNWDDAEDQSQSVLCNTDASQQMSDGTDVVPQYGCLIVDRIPKDLSNLTFRQVKRNPMRFRNIPFLGVAKCLPSCRKRNKILKKEKLLNEITKNQIEAKIKSECNDIIGDCNVIVQQEGTQVSNNVESCIYNKRDVLEVDVPCDLTYDCAMVKNGAQENFKGVQGNDDFTSHDLLAIANDEAKTSTQLSGVAAAQPEVLMFTLNKLEDYNKEHEKEAAKSSTSLNCNSQGLDEISVEQINLTTPENWDKPMSSSTASRRSSSCSNSSLRKNQNSINEKLRHQRLLFTQQQRQGMEHPSTDSVDIKFSKRKRKKRRRRNTQGDSDLQDIVANENQNESKNKKKVKQRRIKRIRIAINGDVATQRQISLVSSSNNNSTTEDDDRDDFEFSQNASDYSGGEHKNEDDSYRENNGTVKIISSDKSSSTDDSDSSNDDDGDDDDANDVSNVSDSDDNSSKSQQSNLDNTPDYEEEDEYEGNLAVSKTTVDFEISNETDVNATHIDTGEYAIVQRQPVNDESGGKKHIVLTIKKTPSKTNSPANSLSSISPLIAATTFSGTDSRISSSLNTNVASKPSSPCSDDTSSTKSKNCEEVLISTKHTKQQNENVSEMVRQTLAENIPPLQYQSIDEERQRRRRRLRRKPKREPCMELELRKLFGSLGSPSCTTSVQDQKLQQKKRHQKLFFPDELFVRSNSGQQLRILNCSSCSSSCAEESDYEYYKSSNEMQYFPDTKFKLNKNCNKVIDKLTEAGGSAVQSDIDALPLPTKASDCYEVMPKNDVTSSDSISSYTSSSDSEEEIDACGMQPELKCKTDDDQMSFDQENYQCDLAISNNGLLESFNVIYPKDCDNSNDDVDKKSLCANVDKLQQLNSLQNKNCDDYNNLYNNNNNLNVIKHNNLVVNNCNYNNNNTSSEKIAAFGAGAIKTEFDFSVAAESNVDAVRTTTTNEHQVDASPRVVKPFSEYSTGIRYVQDVVVDKDDGNAGSSCTSVNMCNRLQQFKEWHQVLQLRSYNDELLTVLPYVLLE